MINSVRLVRFKRFADHTFDLSGDTILLAGPNNSGKTTLFHAISSWNLARLRWLQELGTKKARKKRIGIVLDEFSALPLREMNLLWLNRHTARRVEGAKQPKPAPVYIQVTQHRGRVTGCATLTIEFLYANEKLVYIRPVQSPEDPSPLESIPEDFQNLSIIHVPAFSGIGTQEERRSAGAQHKVVGEGRPGEIVRNLLLDVYLRSQKQPWESLVSDVGRLFKCSLLPPDFTDARPYIVAEYCPHTMGEELPRGTRNRGPRLDIANAGSGFHQVLLLLSFLYAREGAVLLLDEPDAHLHVILQREVFDLLRRLAKERGSQIIVATHSEVLINTTDPSEIVSFVGTSPRRLSSQQERRHLSEAMSRLTAMDIVQVDHVNGVLYVEDDSDFKILRELANTLDHPAKQFLDAPYVVRLGGRGNLNEAFRHFEALRMVKKDLCGVCLIDRDNDATTEPPPGPRGLNVQKWRRCEIENYLVIPDAIKRFVRNEPDQITIEEQAIDARFTRLFPRDIDLYGSHPLLDETKMSNQLVELLRETSRPLNKPDLYMLASHLRPSEIHPEVVEKLDAIAMMLSTGNPMREANLTIEDPGGVSEDNDLEIDGY